MSIEIPEIDFGFLEERNKRIAEADSTKARFTGTIYTAIAYIWPLNLNDLNSDSETIPCGVKFLNGKDAHKTVQMTCSKSIFQYYFWGVTLEIVKYDSCYQCVDVHDITEDERAEYNVGICYALSFNDHSHSVLASNGFVYDLDESIFYNNCKPVLQYMYKLIGRAVNFAMVFYTFNGGLCAILLDIDIKEDRPYYKYAMSRGFVTMNDKMLRGIVPKTQKEFDNRDKLSQDDIDTIIKTMLENK